MARGMCAPPFCWVMLGAVLFLLLSFLVSGADIPSGIPPSEMGEQGEMAFLHLWSGSSSSLGPFPRLREALGCSLLSFAGGSSTLHSTSIPEKIVQIAL
jgi:hypothetical protein